MAIELNMSPNAKAILILAIAAAAIQFGSHAIQKKVLSRPEFQVLQRSFHEQTQMAAATNIPIIQKDTKPKTSSPAFDNSLPDRVFAFIPPSEIKSPPPKPIEPPPIDYFNLLIAGNHLRIDAVMDNGAIINGKFIAINSPITQYAYPANSKNKTKTGAPKMIAPILSETDLDKLTITIREPVKPYRRMALRAIQMKDER